MGQRHQLYLIIHNPLKNEEALKEITDFDNEGKQLAHARKVFGNKKISVLPFHHQWLFGLTAAAVCSNIMKEVLRSNSSKHMFSKEFSRIPHGRNSQTDRIDAFIKMFETVINCQFDTDFADLGARYGVEDAFSISGEGCENDFRNGDNNDGITIIDTINKKYCFMNNGCGDSKMDKLPELIPVSAEQYVEIYYATTKKYLSEYYLEDVCGNDAKKIKELLEENKEVVAFTKKAFANFTLLSLDEVKKLFPKVYNETSK